MELTKHQKEKGYGISESGKLILPHQNKAKNKALHTIKEPKITKHADRFHHMARAEAQKADPHYEMSDRPHLTKGAKIYEEALRRLKK